MDATDPGEISITNGSAPIHLLIVEDERMIQAVLRMQLEKPGYRVSVAEDGRKGLAAPQADPPDLILLDLMQPEMNGFQVPKRVKSLDRLSNIPVLALTASHDEHHKRKGLSHLADGDLTKPYRPEELVATVEKLLASRAEPPASPG